MRLTPYSSIAARHQKVLKHVYSTAEWWWDVFGQLMTEWHSEFEELRGLGCFTIGASQAQGEGRAETILGRAHNRWLQAAEDACDQAWASGRVYPAHRRRGEERVCYIGDLGVTVIASVRARLVTCFRPGGGVGATRRSAERWANKAAAMAARRSGYALRAAVRRQSRHASFSQTHQEE